MIAAPVILPLAAALIVFVWPRAARPLGVTAGVLTLAACGVLAARVASGGTAGHALAGWETPLGIALRVDGLAAAMLLMSGVVGCVVSLYAFAYYRADDSDQARRFWPLWLLLWAGLNGLYISGDLFNLYVLLEVIGIAAVALIVQAPEPEARIAGLRYLLAALTGSVVYLLGVALTYGAYGVLDLERLAAVIEREPISSIALALMSAGLLMKTALVPLHFWLPSAHASASTPVSAILSALVIKASFYLVVRLWFGPFAEVRTPAAAQLVGALASAAILWGSFRAVRQRRMKLLIAHSTVGQIGYFFLLVPLCTVAAAGAPWLAQAWTGGLYQVLAHGFAKASLFLSAGVILRATGSDDLYALRDIAGRLPVASFAIAIAGATLIGLPPTGGFIAKWLLLQATIESGQWWWLPVFVLGSLLTAAYVFLMVRFTFRPASRAEAAPLAPVPVLMQYCALALALGSAVLGMRLTEPLELLYIGAPFTPTPAGVQ